MRKVTLGRTDSEVSAISLGTWSFGGASMSGKVPVGWADQPEKHHHHFRRRPRVFLKEKLHKSITFVNVLELLVEK